MNLLKKLIVWVVFVGLPIFYSSNVFGMFGINSWNDDREPSSSSDVGSNIFAIIVIILMLYRYPTFTLAFLASFSAIAIMINGGNTIAWFVLIVGGSLALYLKITQKESKNKIEPEKINE